MAVRQTQSEAVMRVLTERAAIGDCWEYVGADSQVYPVIGWSGKRQIAHRAVYEVLVGPIPDGLELDHLCRNPRCLNPDHLEPVTKYENWRRGVQWARQALATHCKRGHEFTEANVYRHPEKGSRNCRACMNAAAKRYRTRKKEI